jgi:UDP-N-acetyl-D-galactosamine dehydrogenase
MGRHVADRVVRLMLEKRINVAGAKVLVLGLTFKENCPDLRNTRVTDIIDELRTCHADIDVYDPWVDAAEARREYGLDLAPDLRPGTYDAIVLAVAHHQFTDMGAAALRALGKPDCVLFDVKNVLPRDSVDDRL